MNNLELYYRCGVKESCTANLYLTAAESGCNVNGSPRPGISCFSCCLSTDRRHPFYCINNLDINQVDFKITTGTISEHVYMEIVLASPWVGVLIHPRIQKVFSEGVQL